MTEDASGCQAADIGVLVDPDLIAYSVNGVDLDCYQVCIGELDIVNVTGGDGNISIIVMMLGYRLVQFLHFQICVQVIMKFKYKTENGCTVNSPEVISEPLELTLDFLVFRSNMFWWGRWMGKCNSRRWLGYSWIYS